MKKTFLFLLILFFLVACLPYKVETPTVTAPTQTPTTEPTKVPTPEPTKIHFAELMPES